MSNELKTWPERIWLQHGDSAEVPNYAECADVSWCWHKVDDADVEYVRVDRIAELEKQNAELEKEIAEHSAMLTIAYLDGVAFQRRRVEELERENAELIDRLHKAEAASKWISVDERLPNPEVSVLIAMKNGRIEKTCWYRGEFLRGSSEQPTHWMPLPAAPDSAEKENTDDH